MDEIKLNKEQREAVEYDGGPLLIVAGAGTGKTTVITERIKYLISNEIAKPSEILALTFTEKAALEMEERVDVALPLGYGQMWISTFHSFCDRVLRQEGLAIGIDTSYSLMTTTESAQFVRDNLFEFDLKYFRPLGNPTKFVRGLLQHFSRLQDEDVVSLEYLKWAKSQLSKSKSQIKEEKMESEKWIELAKAYEKYEELKVQFSRFDFGDLIVKTLQLFRERPNVLKQYQKHFSHILVDEYQDTNIGQNELVKLMVEDDSNITVVLDDDQSIYRFRGASVSNAIQFRNNFPKSHLVTLVNNYRTGQEILDKSYQGIVHNNPDRLEVMEGIDKKLVSKIEAKGEVSFIHENRVDAEAEKVVKEIIRLQEKESYDYKDFAILVRANNHAEAFIHTLKRFGIPHQFLGPGKLFEKREVRDLISLLKVLYDPKDSLSFYLLLSINHFEISPHDIVVLTNAAKKTNTDLLEYCRDKMDKVLVSDNTKDIVVQLVTIVDSLLLRSKDDTAGKLIYLFLEKTGMLSDLINPDTEHSKESAENLAVFFDKLKSYEVSHDDAGVRPVVDWIDLLKEQGESPKASVADWSDQNAVNILTVHSSKGLEFPVVFIVNLVNGRFPSINRREQIPIPGEMLKEDLSKGDSHMQEERRLFYVAMTRAKKYLYLTAADYYGEGKRAKKLSPFIFEALGEDSLAREVVGKDHFAEQLSFADYGKNHSQNIDILKPSKLHIDYLSYTHIQTFQMCPLHYKLRYILRIPSEPTAPLSFGMTLHEVMRRIYVSRLNGETLSQKRIVEVLNEVWASEGYSHKKHEQKMKEKGRVYLEEYYDKSYKRGVSPILIEYPFVVNISDKSGKGRPLKIGGKIDRVDQLPQGTIEILDYKTGEKVPTQKDVDKNEQLTFYSLASSKISDPPFADVKIKNVKLSLYYFEGQTKTTTSRTKDQLVEFERKLFELRDEIENSDFKCSGNYFCKTCEYNSLCNA